VLVYVWAIEQDELSKRAIPRGSGEITVGEDVFVPWVMSKELQGTAKQKAASQSPDIWESTPQPSVQSDKHPQVFNRYYHMFAHGELTKLVMEAASELGLRVGPPSSGAMQGIEIVQDSWERSNYYVELRRWQSS
jgi:tRNA (uracil-5-)-methyltransferase TRM9